MLLCCSLMPDDGREAMKGTHSPFPENAHECVASGPIHLWSREEVDWPKGESTSEQKRAIRDWENWRHGEGEEDRAFQPN